MSLYDYEVGKEINSKYGDDEFYGIIQAAMRLADTDNLEKLKTAFPETWQDLHSRYHAPGGRLPGDPQEEAREFVECTEENPCCGRRNEYNGFGSDGSLKFTCPKHCSCHD